LGGLAIALAAQDALANLIGYFMILADEPYLIGEYIIVDDKAGIVEGIGFRSTRIRVLDQSLIVIPNKIMESEAITNWSRLNKRRLDVTLGLSYKSTTGQVLCVVQDIRQMLVAHSLVYPDSVLVQFTELADNALNLTILCFVKTPSWHDFQSVRQDINLKILDIMAKWSVDNANPEFDINIEPKPIQQLTVQEIVSPAPPATS
jgi:MscS family membrane protein